MPHTQYLICYDLNEAMDHQIFEHPGRILKNLGIRFKSQSFDQLLHQWLFHECTHTPADIPGPFLKIRYPSPDPEL